jgi:transposase
MVDSQRTRILCTPATVGILTERGLSMKKVSRKLHVSLSTVGRYLGEWRAADEASRTLARSGTRI